MLNVCTSQARYNQRFEKIYFAENFYKWSKTRFGDIFDPFYKKIRTNSLFPFADLKFTGKNNQNQLFNCSGNTFVLTFTKISSII